MMKKVGILSVCLCALFAVCASSLIFANGGPFRLKAPEGDPSARGGVALLDPNLMPANENRLRVVKEDLKIEFNGENDLFYNGVKFGPMVIVSATYSIENPTDKEIEVDFGFPVLRAGNFYGNSVTVDNKPVECGIFGYPAIYGVIRQRARETIHAGIDRDAELKKLVDAVEKNKGEDGKKARQSLREYLTAKLKWTEQDSALFEAYATLNLGKFEKKPADANLYLDKNISTANLGALKVIGEQKATQFFGVLASKFDAKQALTYENLFKAWGGDVRERSVDLKSGKIRPREKENKKGQTVYARVDYLDNDATLGAEEKETCKSILKNLPVVFTFAPMNLFHYRVKFPPKQTLSVQVSYNQYAYKDTAEPESHQFTYVVHPASLWKDFGPINLEICVPKGVEPTASVALEKEKAKENVNVPYQSGAQRNQQAAPAGKTDSYRTVLKDKTGELFIAVTEKSWRKSVTPVKESKNNSNNSPKEQKARAQK